ncbi:DUF3141 domain-containing protein [Bordetella genomosp. 5]|uniref:3-hydroxyalkanoate synthetase n=1 Tax=Bordetella genomosp. 5 TaxID=1395608 RepID=A0A261T9A0_9BORD|nr:DUF3141 domain-containing protein [Bordetella genomosp. 5]OZI45680.1 3-hydroxyalkanoate synthetase [Bordetella genomosp. 5]
MASNGTRKTSESPTPAAAAAPAVNPEFPFNWNAFPLAATPAGAAGTDAWSYLVDAWQRGVLYTDVLRQRGNQYLSHMAKKAPNVLSMESEVILDGRELARPVNYMLLRIIPPADAPVDPEKRPFLVVDPRAGHGPGIGGFKPESEIGVAVRAGHPTYFASFLPQPTPTQTVEDVMRAEARFLEEIIARHPEAEGKPVVVGNCQAGWQIMMTAAMRPELFGPIIVAGAPLSYWAGWRGMNPMRYSGGMLGGSWLTELTSDAGNGRFDGAWLVQNFENLNPANTLWSKQYNLYAKVDTEAERYLEFEKWWGGHVYLNGPEIQYIVDNLFVGNRLATAGLVTSDGIRIDLRNIRSPIIVFCSKGDNITPPPQALGWIPDLYQDDAEVVAHGQTIVYAVHESIGHLGIFVSGSVARKEHQEFTSNIDLIDVLPPGIYQTEIADKTPETANADLAYGNYVLSFASRKLDDVRGIVQRIEEDERRFAAVARISDINLGLYRSFLKPWIQASVTPHTAEWAQRMHPLRLPYELLSDHNPLIAPFKQVAEQVRADRQPAAPDNPFLIMQTMMSQAIESSLDIWRELRDDTIERVFMNVYGSPLVQDWAGLGARPGAPRKHPGVSPEHHEFMGDRAHELRDKILEGGLHEAAMRMLLYVTSAEGSIDERSFSLIREMRANASNALALQTFKDMVREQALILRLDGAAAIRAIPHLLEDVDADAIATTLATMKRVLEAAEPLSDRARQSLDEMQHLFESCAQRARRRRGKSATTRPILDAQADVEATAEKIAGRAAGRRPLARLAPDGDGAPKPVGPARKKVEAVPAPAQGEGSDRAAVKAPAKTARKAATKTAAKTATKAPGKTAAPRKRAAARADTGAATTALPKRKAARQKAQ